MSAAGSTVQMWGERSAVSSALAAACDEAGAELVFRADGPSSAAASAEPALLVALLPAGERSLPPELVQQLDTRADLSLLLLCEEALVRPTLTIQQGRIVLLEPPLTVSRIEARLRLLMTARCIDTTGCLRASSPEPPLPVPHARYRTADYWFAVFMGASTTAGRAPSWRTSAGDGLCWALSASTADAASVSACSSAPPAAENIDTERGLRAALGIGGALVQLDPSAREWRFLLPDDGSLLRLFSHQRLPRAWDAGRALTRCSSRFFRLTAAPGDVVCLMTPPPPGLGSTLERSALDGGGPALLEALIQRRSPPAPEAMAGVVVEVM